jgi:hypothetical protein
MNLDYATLAALRTHHPAWRLLRSDHAAVMAHRSLWNAETLQARHDLPRLNRDEQALFDDLR